MPAFNSASTIIRAIESVRSQTFTDWSLTIVDDGSTDDTSKIVRAYLKKHALTNIRLETLAANVGVAQARNVGISLSAGTWLVFFDADDEMYDTHLENLLRETSDDIDIVICGRTVVLPDGKTYEEHSPAVGTFSGTEAARLSLCDKITPFPWDRMVRRELFNGIGFPLGAVRCEDSMTNIVLCSRARRVTSIPASGIRYYVSGGSITWGKVYTMDDTRIAWEYMLANIPPALHEGRFRNAIACARATVALVIAHTAMMRFDPKATDERKTAVTDAIAESRAHLHFRDAARSLVVNQRTGLAALIFKVTPGIYARLYRRYVASSYGFAG